MKVAYICNFSYPVKEGVWNNVYNTARYMIKKGHEVHVFSSNLNPIGKLSGKYEEFEGIKIHRFPIKFKIGSYGLFWNFEKKLEKIHPDIIHTHVYRNPHSHKALKIAKKLKVPCFLTTHAPFVERKLRSFSTNLIIRFYDWLYGKSINKYEKIIIITKWELPFLYNLGARKEKIEYIPNGIDKDFLKIKLNKKFNKQAIYLGRISQIKNLGLIIKAAKSYPQLKFKVIGPIEKGYNIKTESKNLIIKNKIFNKKEQKKYLEKSDIYILASKREGFPQTLLEAIAAGKIILASNIKGAKEVIEDGKTGFLFSNIEDLRKKIEYIEKNYGKLMKIRKEARKKASKFLWEDLNKKILQLYLKARGNGKKERK